MARLAVALLLTLLLAPLAADAQPSKLSVVGVILHGGSYRLTLDGLRAGLQAAGLEEGKQYALEIRETKGDLTAVEDAAKELVRGKVDLLYRANPCGQATRHRISHCPPSTETGRYR